MIGAFYNVVDNPASDCLCLHNLHDSGFMWAADEEMPGDPSSIISSAAAAAAAEAAAATALASFLRTSCTIIDMGSFLLTEVRSKPYTADDAALAIIAGAHVRQILPEALVARAAVFPPFDRLRQVCTDTQKAQLDSCQFTACARYALTHRWPHCLPARSLPALGMH